jgi:hypothetical protein
MAGVAELSHYNARTAETKVEPPTMEFRLAGGWRLSGSESCLAQITKPPESERTESSAVYSAARVVKSG